MPMKIGLDNKQDKSRQYFTNSRIPMYKIYEELEKRIAKSEKETIEKTRCQMILKTRDLEALKKRYIGKNGEDEEIVNKIFEILSNSDTFEMFLNYNDNKEFFSLDKTFSIHDYLKMIGKIFGNINKEGKSIKIYEIMSQFHIQDPMNFFKRVRCIYQEHNLDRFSNPDYEFKRVNGFKHEEIIETKDEPNWSISPKLYDEVYKDMPKELSLEEKAIYIYKIM